MTRASALIIFAVLLASGAHGADLDLVEPRDDICDLDTEDADEEVTEEWEEKCGAGGGGGGAGSGGAGSIGGGSGLSFGFPSGVTFSALSFSGITGGGGLTHNSPAHIGPPPVFNPPLATVPGPVVGSGLVGLIAGCAGLVVLVRRRRR